MGKTVKITTFITSFFFLLQILFSREYSSDLPGDLRFLIANNISGKTPVTNIIISDGKNTNIEINNYWYFNKLNDGSYLLPGIPIEDIIDNPSNFEAFINRLNKVFSTDFKFQIKITENRNPSVDSALMYFSSQENSFRVNTWIKIINYASNSLIMEPSLGFQLVVTDKLMNSYRIDGDVDGNISVIDLNTLTEINDTGLYNRMYEIYSQFFISRSEEISKFIKISEDIHKFAMNNEPLVRPLEITVKLFRSL